MSFVLQKQTNSRAPSTGMNAHQINDQPSGPLFDDFTTYTQDWLACVFVLDMINLMT